jgi:hypothetical protein
MSACQTCGACPCYKHERKTVAVPATTLRDIGDEVAALEVEHANAKTRLAWYEQRVIDLERELAECRARMP